MERRRPPESDWKRFRALRENALERFCERVLEQVEEVVSDDARSHHERYLELFRLFRERDGELAGAFDNPRRSDMLRQLAALYVLGLVPDGELEGFSTATRESVAVLADVVRL